MPCGSGCHICKQIYQKENGCSDVGEHINSGKGLISCTYRTAKKTAESRPLKQTPCDTQKVTRNWNFSVPIKVLPHTEVNSTFEWNSLLLLPLLDITKKSLVWREKVKI